MPKQGIFGLISGIVGTTDEREIRWDAISIPLGHEEDDPKAEDIGMVLAEACLLGHRLLWPPLSLERTVAHQIEDAILGWGKRLQGLVGEPLQQRLGAPVCGTQQTAILLNQSA
jgi:hypothetical protein